MLGGIFQKRKKIQELRAPSLQDIKKFREVYGRHAERRHVETPACFERSIYKAISCQKELHSVDFRQEDVTDPQIIALAETLLEMPLVSSLDLRDNRITDDGAKALLEVLRLQIIAAKTPPKTDPRTKKVLPPPAVPEFTRYITNVNLKGNEISPAVLDEMALYAEILKREDKRLEIRTALNQVDRNAGGGVDEEDFKAVVKLLTGTEPNKKEIKQLMGQANASGDNQQNSIALENVLLAKCSSSPPKKTACPPWEALVQVQHAKIGNAFASPLSAPKAPQSPEPQPLSSPLRDAKPVEASHNIQTSSTLSAQQPGAVNPVMLPSAAAANAVFPPPPAPTTPSPTPKLALIIDMIESPSKQKVDFGPPSSPPPPLPLPPSPTSDRRLSSAPASSKSRSSADNAGDQAFPAPLPETVAIAKSPVERSSPGLARQNSNDSHRSLVTPSTPSMPASPAGRDDYSMEFSSWRDDDPFGDDGEEPDQPRERETTGGDEIESVRSREFSPSVASRHSAVSSSKPSQPTVTINATNNQKFNGGSSPPSKFCEYSHFDKDESSTRRELSTLAYSNCANESPISNSPFKDPQPSQLQPVVDADDKLDEEEECYDSTVLDIMRDGKLRNVATVVHSEFKRGLALQDFPGEVPFRNLVALILSGNGLRDLGLFKECRFPCTSVLDLSQNTLSRISDEELACFPKLQVLDLSCNRMRAISGVGKLFDIRALSLCNNQLRNVINIEHLAHLQILRLRSNVITATSALRLLSLNKMLTHLDLDDNPLMETDERQRRKVTVHILNVVPLLSTLGSEPIAGHHSKDKRKLTIVDSPMGKSLMDHSECPELRLLWVSNACDILQIVQDREPERTRPAYDDDDSYGDSGYGGEGTSPVRPKKLNRNDQLQKDDLRSKSVGYRSREKAPPSPTRAKVSPFEFGPPLPRTPRKSPKKKVVDSKLAQEQQRRASLLSAPKHPPVDTNQLKQQQRHKSRPTFDVNMSVAERLQLVREKSLRRTSTLATHSELTAHHRPSTPQHTVNNCKRGSEHTPAIVMEIRAPSSPARTSPMRHQSIVEFRVEPLPMTSPLLSPANNQQLNLLQSPSNATIDPLSVSASGASGAVDGLVERKTSLKETSFLQSLAVTDFLSHAEEEISTAQTALNVLLSMCERSPTDSKKLSEYRNSLEALDILDERESQELFQRARNHDDPHKVRECSSAFEKLRTLKKCIKDLLQKLEVHTPGSPTIRSYCTDLRTKELRNIIENVDGCVQPISRNTELASVDTRVETQSSTSSPVIVVKEPAVMSLEPSPTLSVHSKLFASAKHDELEPAEADVEVARKDEDEDEFDFLSSDTSMFDDDKPAQPPSAPAASIVDDVTIPDAAEVDKILSTRQDESLVRAPEAEASSDSHLFPPQQERNERSLSATSTDITQDITQVGFEDDNDFDFDTELPLDEEPPLEDGVVDDAEIAQEPPASKADIVAAQEDEEEFDWDPQDAEEEAFVEKTAVVDVEESEEVRDVSFSQDAEDSVEAVDPTAEHEFFLTEEDHREVDQQYEEAGEEEEAGEDEQPHQREEFVEVDDEDDEEAETFGDWEKGFDPTTNHYFWFNHESGESQWVPPEGWPYEVDTPFEDDAEEQLEDEECYETGQVEDDHAQQTDDQPESPTKSSFEAENDDDDDDDVFSDQDLPDF